MITRTGKTYSYALLTKIAVKFGHDTKPSEMMVIGNITIADLNVKQSQPVGNNGYQGHTPRINITRSNCDIPKQVLAISPEVITGRFTYKLLLQFFSPAGFWNY